MNISRILLTGILLLTIFPSGFAQQTKSVEFKFAAHNNAFLLRDGKNVLKEQQRYFALKTNFAAWTGTVMNAAVDVQAGDRLSVELPVAWCPWKISDNRSIKVFAFQPEVRWWLVQPGEGHFFGLHTHIAWYNGARIDTRTRDYWGITRVGVSIAYRFNSNQ